MSFAFLGLKSIKSPTQIKNIPKSIIVHFDNMSIIFICLLVVCKVARRVAGNGRVYETFGISKRFPIKLQLLLIRAETLDKPLIAKCFIHVVRHWRLFFLSNIINLFNRSATRPKCVCVGRADKLFGKIWIAGLIYVFCQCA